MRYFGLDEGNRLVPHLTQTFAGLRSLRGAPRGKALGAATRTLASLAESGMVVKDAGGLVDLPARLGDRTVVLCWAFGEKEVGHWHDAGEACTHRRPVLRAESFQPVYLS